MKSEARNPKPEVRNPKPEIAMAVGRSDLSDWSDSSDRPEAADARSVTAALHAAVPPRYNGAAVRTNPTAVPRPPCPNAPAS